MKQYHTELDCSDIGKYVLLPGNPKRVRRMAEYLDHAAEVADSREFCSWTGYLDGVRVSIVSTGIGGPSAAIAVEELAALGVHTVIRTGTCGMLQPESRRGDLMIATGCVRGGATTHAYVPVGYPAVADFRVVGALLETACERGYRCRTGIVECKDAFALESPQSLPLCARAKENWDVWIRAGVIATEMESDTIMVVSSLRGMRAGAVLFGLGSYNGVEDMSPMTDMDIERLSLTALGAVRRLIIMDSNDARSSGA